jgi:hypothetical protein
VIAAWRRKHWSRGGLPVPRRRRRLEARCRPGLESMLTITVQRSGRPRTAGARAAAAMTVTVNAGIDHGQGARIDHLVLSPLLAAALVPGSYRVHVSDLGDRG